MSSGQAADGAPVLEAAGLTKRYAAPSLVEAVRGATFAVNGNDMVALVGPSGAGKSTLLGLLGGLQSPSEGVLRICGREVSGLRPEELARIRNLNVGFVFQFHHLLPELTAEENVALPALVAEREGWKSLGLAAIADRAVGLLAAVGLAGRERHLPSQLSGGEAQRVALARALVNNPAVVLADEPTGNLDVNTASELMDLFEKLNRETGCAFLIATHNADLMGRAKRVLRMKNGEMDQ